ncbi:hypothetical protein QTJ16_000508 [Diplocarpon rosae]|uniref:Uncharacterized protein n=1 Tax=Diplocarpon rosae TaxID=946125 RepID=A0AAD9WGV0_9HELO|nr:hypothetical protein QTJ16_000508 [Diplocarpon rosae]
MVCFCRSVVWVLCLLSVHAFWLRPRFTWDHVARSEPWTMFKEAGGTRDTSSVMTPYSFPVPSTSVMKPTSTYEGKLITTVVPIYELCDIPGRNTTSCSTVLKTITRETCSTILTYAFSKTTISDCTHIVTFSSQTEYALSTTVLAVTSGLKAQIDSPGTASSTTVTYAQSTTSYFSAPWQSLAADTPAGITVLICTTDFLAVETCKMIEEVWIVRTEYVPITTTSTLSFSACFPSEVVLLLGPTQSIVASAGNFSLSTLIEYPTMSPNTSTSTSIISSINDVMMIEGSSGASADTRTSTTTLTRTKTRIGDTSTITMTLNVFDSAKSPTTTVTSRTTLTSTITVEPVSLSPRGHSTLSSDMPPDPEVSVPVFLEGNSKSQG